MRKSHFSDIRILGTMYDFSDNDVCDIEDWCKAYGFNGSDPDKCELWKTISKGVDKSFDGKRYVKIGTGCIL